MSKQANGTERPQLSINQIEGKVSRNGDKVTYMIEGNMGTGKSSILRMAQQKHGDKYNYCYVDCTQWDVGDVNLPDADKELEVVRFLPNYLLVGDRKKPMYIMLDELTKAARPVMNALLPVMLERRVGMVSLPEGSIVCATGNLSGEGVGDNMQPHARNRIIKLRMRNPSSDEWIAWGMENNIHPSVLAWAHETPQLFHSWEDTTNPGDNPYIFHPKEHREAFVTPRSLAAASLEVWDRDMNGASMEEVLAGLYGAIGPRGALDLNAFVLLNDQIPRYKDIIAAPDTALVPDAPAAICTVVFSCVSRVEKAELNTLLQYIQRFPLEMQALFATQLMRIPSKMVWAAMTQSFTSWVVANSWALT